MRNGLTMWHIAYRNVKCNVYRTSVMILFIFVLTAGLFSSMVILTSLESGIKSTSERLGADIVVVPANYYSSIEDALFTGEPCTVYFEKAWVERMEEIEGMESVSSQLFLSSLGEECCESLIQLIAFDEEDFVISPWIRENTNKKITQYEVMAGSKCGLTKGQQVSYYGVAFTVAGVLEYSGMGYDYSIFLSFDGARRMLDSEAARNFLTVQSDEVVSMINLKVKDGYEIEEVSSNIAAKYPEIAVYTTNKMFGHIEKNIRVFSSYSKIITVLLAFLCMIAVMSLFSITVNERKREYGIFTLFGTSRKQLVEMVLSEAIIILFIGTFLGIVVSAVLLQAFQNLIAVRIEMPYLILDVWSEVKIAIKSIMITLGVGSVSTAYAILRLISCNGIELLKEGD